MVAGGIKLTPNVSICMKNGVNQRFQKCLSVQIGGKPQITGTAAHPEGKSVHIKQGRTERTTLLCRDVSRSEPRGRRLTDGEPDALKGASPVREGETGR